MGNGCMKAKTVEVTSPTLPSFKVVVVGDSGSGKTSVIRRFVENRYEPEYTRTTDVDITSVVKKLNVPEHAIVTVELWDVPGQNDVDLRKTYYLDVDAVIVVVDISQDDSLNVAGSWSLDVSNHARVSRTFTESIPNPDGKTFAKKIRKEYLRPKMGSIPVLLLGNKYDLAKGRYIKEMEEAEESSPSPIEEKESPENGEVNQSQSNSNQAEPQKDTDTSKSDTKLQVNGDSQNSNDEPAHSSQNETNPQNSVKEVPATQGDGEETKSDAETPEKQNGQPVSNGHVGNGDVSKKEDDPRLTLKKIHPKDEKKMNILNGNSLETLATPEDAKSAVTMATSVLSILPPCVEEIDKITEKYGFIAGVPVSARTTNGGVQEAIQSILRRLVAKKLFNLDAKEAVLERKNRNLEVLSTRSAKSALSKTSKSKKKYTGNFEPLQEVGIIEIDEVIKRCNPPLQEAEDLTAGYAEALQGFKMICYKSGFIASARVTLEACTASLKQAVATNSDSSNQTNPRENIKLILMSPEKQAEQERSVLSLVVDDRDGFPDLRIVNTQGDDVEELNENALKPEDKINIQPKVLKVLKEYRENLFQRSLYCMKHGDGIEAVLGKLSTELAAKEEKAWETSVAAGLSPDEVRRILSAIAQDKARLRGTKELVHETRKSVQSSAGKIKAALLF